MKALFTFFLAVTVFSVSAQDGVIVKYFDSTMQSVSKEKAYYIGKFIKEDTSYKCLTYFYPSMIYNGIAFVADTSLSKFIGLNTGYYQDGKLEDSEMYSKSGKPLYSYVYYRNGQLKDSIIYGDGDDYDGHVYFESGKLRVHFHWDKILKKRIDEGFDERGNIIPNYIYQKEAEFPGGADGWKNYLMNHLRTNVPAKHKAPMGKYSVTVVFLVDKEGAISDVHTENDPGFGTRAEAMRVIKNSPKWTSAIWLNNLVNYSAKQQITFVVTDN